jgi:hypothetical protein
VRNCDNFQVPFFLLYTFFSLFPFPFSFLLSPSFYLYFLQVEEADVEKILDWAKTAGNVEIPFKPARVILQDFTYVSIVSLLSIYCPSIIYLLSLYPSIFILPLLLLYLVNLNLLIYFISGVPAVVDLAAMRDAMKVHIRTLH